MKEPIHRLQHDPLPNLLWILLVSALTGCSQRSGALEPESNQNGPLPTPGCTAELKEATDALSRGDYSTALEHSRCDSTPASSMVEGASRLMLSIESEAVSAVLARASMKPMKAVEVLGPDGFFSRHAKLWRGSGSLTITSNKIRRGATIISAASESSPLEFGFVRARSNSVESRNFGSSTGSEPYISLQSGDSGSPGWSAVRSGTSISVAYDCQTGRRLPGTIPVSLYLNLSATYGEGYHVLSPDSTFPDLAHCEEDGGSVTFTKFGQNTGDEVEINFTNLLLVADGYGFNSAQKPFLRVSGTLRGQFYVAFDTSSLHELLALAHDEDRIQNLLHPTQPGSTAEAIVGELSSLIPELELAAAAFERGGAYEGKVFTLPGTLFGGVDIPVTGGDALLLAGVARASVAALQLAGAYAMPLDLTTLCPPGQRCLEGRAWADAVNAAVAGWKRRSFMGDAKKSLMQALSDFQQGLRKVGPESLFAKSDSTTHEFDQVVEMLGAVSQSLTSGPTAIPYTCQMIPPDPEDPFGQWTCDPIITPMRLNLQQFFDNPVDPSTLSTDPLVVEIKCYSPDNCRDEVLIVEAFFEEWLGDAIDSSWTNGNCRFKASLSSSFSSLMKRLEKHGLLTKT